MEASLDILKLVYDMSQAGPAPQIQRAADVGRQAWAPSTAGTNDYQRVTFSLHAPVISRPCMYNERQTDNIAQLHQPNKLCVCPLIPASSQDGEKKLQTLISLSDCSPVPEMCALAVNAT